MEVTLGSDKVFNHGSHKNLHEDSTSLSVCKPYHNSMIGMCLIKFDQQSPYPNHFHLGSRDDFCCLQ